MRFIKITVLLMIFILPGSWVNAVHAAAAIEVTLCKSLSGDDPVNPTTVFPKDSQAIYAAWKSSDVVILSYQSPPMVGRWVNTASKFT
jgi:hypothetical protein